MYKILNNVKGGSVETVKLVEFDYGHRGLINKQFTLNELIEVLNKQVTIIHKYESLFYKFRDEIDELMEEC